MGKLNNFKTKLSQLQEQQIVIWFKNDKKVKNVRIDLFLICYINLSELHWSFKLIHLTREQFFF